MPEDRPLKKLAIVPARGGSRRIPDKNIKPFLGRPIIERVIRAARESGLFDLVMVSTDSDRIAEVAVAAGAEVPFLRSEKNSDDRASITDALVEALTRLGGGGECPYGVGCCLLPTAVFVTPRQLQFSHEKFSTQDFDSLIPICRFSYPVQRSLRTAGPRLSFADPKNTFVRSQDLEPRYHDAGQYYWFKTAELLQKKSIITDNTTYTLVDERFVQDIDTPEDWDQAEFKFSYLKEKGML